MKAFSSFKVWAQNVGTHFTQQHIIHGKTWSIFKSDISDIQQRKETYADA